MNDGKDLLFSTLERFFGFREFRPLQEEILRTILDGKDCVAILPTGGGKSLCFQLPGLMMSGNVIVISPLISLMSDQVSNLVKKGVSAVALHSSLEKSEKEKLRAEILVEKYKFLYVSPETLASQWFSEHARELNIELVVIDEAHCISEWGHNFRPEYLRINEWVKLLPERPVIAAFTASATPETVKDISTQLQLKDPKHFRQSIIRPNLSLQVIPCPTKTIQHLVLLRILNHHAGQSLIIYGATHDQTETTAQILTSYGFVAEAYHGGLESHKRQRIQEAFLENKITIICATTAFGMGVDKPNIRCVIHLTHPASLEHYYQEVGRAGRDREESWCYLLTLPQDAKLQHQIISRSYSDFSRTEKVLRRMLFLAQKKRRKFSCIELYIPFQEEFSAFQFSQILAKGEELEWWKVVTNEKQEKYVKLCLTFPEICDNFEKLTWQYNHQCQKLIKIISYCERKSCRMRQLLGYFEPKDQHKQYIQYRCGKCDVCKPAKIHRAIVREKQQYRSLFLSFFEKRKEVMQTFYTQGKSLDWSVAGLALEVLATSNTYLPQTNCQLPGIGRGWKEIIGQLETLPETSLVKTGQSSPDPVFSVTGHRSRSDPMAQYQLAPQRISLDK